MRYRVNLAKEGEQAAEGEAGGAAEDLGAEGDVVDGQARGIEDGDFPWRAAAGFLLQQHLTKTRMDLSRMKLPSAHRHVEFPTVDRLRPLIDDDGGVLQDA